MLVTLDDMIVICYRIKGVIWDDDDDEHDDDDDDEHDENEHDEHEYETE